MIHCFLSGWTVGAKFWTFAARGEEYQNQTKANKRGGEGPNFDYFVHFDNVIIECSHI